jgi:DNA-binding CsgD family transcriptional regulator
VQEPVTVPVLPGVTLAKIYGLTPAELRVLLAMSPGLGIKEAADILGIGETTAKTHLQRIFSKTGTSKQTELTILLRNSVPPGQRRLKSAIEVGRFPCEFRRWRFVVSRARKLATPPR